MSITTDRRHPRAPSPVARLRALLLPLLIGLFAAMFLSQHPAVASDLMLYPTRIVFEKNQRAAQLELVNRADSAQTYRIELVRRRMTPHGDFTAAEPALPDERFADGMLRFSPRQVTLAPGESQVVRVQLRRPAGLEPAEYRSHLMFSPVTAPEGPSAPGPAVQPQGLDINLVPRFAVSIPVIVRHGQLDASADLADLSLSRDAPAGPPILAFEIRRQGSRSIYADVTVLHVDAGGREHRLARAGGVAVYTPNAARHVRMALPTLPERSGGSLRVVLNDGSETDRRQLAVASLPLD